MVNAIVLLKVDPQKINEVAEQLAGKEHVSEVYSVAGRYDVVVILRARDAEALSDAVTKSFLKVEGVQSSETQAPTSRPRARYRALAARPRPRELTAMAAR